MGGITSSGVIQNVSNLKKVIAKTTKATKVSRGSQQPKPEDGDNLIDEHMIDAQEEKKEPDNDEEDEEGSADVHMDIDGKKKKAVTEYDGDSQSEAGSEMRLKQAKI